MVMDWVRQRVEQKNRDFNFNTNKVSQEILKNKGNKGNRQKYKNKEREAVVGH